MARANKREEKRLKPNIILFYFCYSLIIACSMLRSVIVLTDLANMISRICIVILIFASIISLSRIERKKAILFLAITIVAIITRVISGNNYFLLTWLFAVAARSIDFKQIVKYDLLIKLPFMIIVPYLYFAGMTEVNIHYRDGIARHSMGFSNPNVFSAYLTSMVVDFLYYRKDKFGVMEVIVALISGLVIDYYSDSRTSILCIILMTVLMVVFKIRKNKKIEEEKIGIIGKISKHSYVILLILSLATGMLYSANNATLVEIDKVTSTRVSSASRMLENYDINLLGNDVEIVTKKESELTGKQVSPLDNMYVFTTLAYGAIATIIYCISMKKYFNYTLAKDKTIGYFMLIYLLAGLMERFPMDPRTNIMLLYFSQLLYEETKNEKKDKEDVAC